MNMVADIDFRLKEAMDIWVEWMHRSDNKSLGFGRCSGVDTSSSVSGWNEFERSVEKDTALNVQAVYEGLPLPQRLAIDHFHLAAVWRSNRSSLEADYTKAMAGMAKGLQKRNIL